jgi:tRNA (adenine22-N1)-methyltransferase
MTNLSNRLVSLSLWVDKKDNVIDVGSDHALLPIYLKENNLCNKVIATDINQNALDSGIYNIKRSNLDIESYLSNGLKDIDTTDYNTVIIAGMGTKTIKEILSYKEKLKTIDKLILQSNKDLFELREFMDKKGYYLKEEQNIFDKGIWYSAYLYIKSDKKNTEEEIKYGLLNNKDFINHLISKYEELLSKIPPKNKAYKELKSKVDYLKVIISK